MLRKTLFQILVFLVPTQLSLHLWPEWAYVFGIRVDYLSPTVYLTDLLIFFLVILWLTTGLAKKGKGLSPVKPVRVITVVALLVFILINTFIAQRPQVAFVKWLKIFELFLVAVYIAKEEEFQYKEWLAKPLVYSVAFFSSVAIFQFLNQRTVGGPFYLFGERGFNAATPGIALSSLFGRQFLRPYSTFPHPNALAGYMLVSLILLSGTKFKGIGARIAMAIAKSLAGIVIVISVSRAAWTASVMIIVLYLIVRKNNRLLKKVSLFLVVTLLSLGLLLPFATNFLLVRNFGFDEGIEKRIKLANNAGRMISNQPLFGNGLGNFVIKLPEVSKTPTISWWLQPVHNIFLLIFTETGILGLLLFMYLIFKAIDNSLVKKERVLIMSTLAILLTGFLDHYWITLQQNQLLFSLALGLSFKNRVKKRI